MMGARDERKGLKLYVKRVFIMDAAEQLLPAYLRFVRGVVDSDDLPLNVSREILQQNRNLEKLRAACTRRVLDLLDKLANGRAGEIRDFLEGIRHHLQGRRRRGLCQQGTHRQAAAFRLDASPRARRRRSRSTITSAA